MKLFSLLCRSPFRREISRCLCLLAGTVALLNPPLAYADNITCPSDHRERGKKPPAGTEWQCLNQNGQPDGPWLTWYDSGQLMSERQMKNGREHGRQRSWWPNGQLMMEGISYEGSRYKGFKYWSINGEPTQLNIETETVTKQVDETGKPLPAKKPVAPLKPTAPSAK